MGGELADYVDLSGNWEQQIIHKSHEHILNAYLDGCTIKVVDACHKHWGQRPFNDFVENYCENCKYLSCT